MSARANTRSFRAHVEDDLEIMPLMNLFVALIPMLLISAVFLNVTVIDMKAPPPGETVAQDPGEAAGPHGGHRGRQFCPGRQRPGPQGNSAGRRKSLGQAEHGLPGDRGRLSDERGRGHPFAGTTPGTTTSSPSWTPHATRACPRPRCWAPTDRTEIQGGRIQSQERDAAPAEARSS